MWTFFLHKIKQILPTNKVTKVQLSLATIYAFAAWNLTILTFYYSIKQDLPTTTESKKKLVEKMKESSVDVEFIQYKGINITNSEQEENETNMEAI